MRAFANKAKIPQQTYFAKPKTPSDTAFRRIHETESDSSAASRFSYDFSQIKVHATIQTSPNAGKLVWRKPAGNAQVETASPIAHEVLRSPGQPLDKATRAFMEPRFGHDFSQIRVHTDSQAATSARTVDALAYTVGRDIVFAQGQFAPHTVAGRRLLAHELAHTVQQPAGADLVPAGNLHVAPPNNSFETEAERVASSVLSAQDKEAPKKIAITPLPSSGHPTLRRQPAPDDHIPDKTMQKKEEGGGKEKVGTKAPTPAQTECKPPSNITLPCTPKGLAAADFMKIGAPSDAMGYTHTVNPAPPPPAVLTKPVGKGGRVLIQKTEAKPVPCESSFIKAGPGSVPRIVALNPKDPKQAKYIEQCGKTYVGLFRITPEGEKKLSEAEMEHCKDFKHAFDISIGCYAAAVNDLAAKGTTFASQDDAENALTQRVGRKPDTWMDHYIELLEKTKVRDDKWHTAVSPPGPLFLDIDNRGHCKSQQATEINEDSYPDVGKDKKTKKDKHPTEDIIR